MNESVVAFRMTVKPGLEAEYKRRHDEIWPALRVALQQAGVLEYRIFLDLPTGSLFAYQRLAPDADKTQLPTLPLMKQWWNYMADLMDVNADNSPVVTVCPEVFSLYSRFADPT